MVTSRPCRFTPLTSKIRVPVPNNSALKFSFEARLRGFLISRPISSMTFFKILPYQVSDKTILLNGNIATSETVKPGFITNEGSTFNSLPMPLQAGQAPWGELNDSSRGSISGMEMLHHGQANFSEKR